MNFKGIEKLSDLQLHQLYGWSLLLIKRHPRYYNTLCKIYDCVSCPCVFVYFDAHCPCFHYNTYRDIEAIYLFLDELEYECDLRGLPKDFFAERLERQ